MHKESPKFESVRVDGDTIIFTDNTGREGEITEYGAVYNDHDRQEELVDAGQEPAFSGQSHPNKLDISELPEAERLKFDYNRAAKDIYGDRGQVPKAKK